MAHVLHKGMLGVVGRRAHGAMRNLSALLALVTVCVVVGVSEAFVAPSASLPPAGGGGSALSKAEGQGRARDTRLVDRSGSSGGGGSLSMSADGDGNQAGPKKLAAVVYTYVDGMEDKRAPFRSAHLDLLKTMTDEGTCLLGGAFLEPCDGAVLLFSSPDEAQQFVDKDPYNTGGLVTKYQIRDYMAVVGTMLTK